MRKAIIIHGWCESPNDGFFPWLKKELEQTGFVVEAPVMVPVFAPTLQDWVPQIAKAVNNPTQDTYLIGHSIGCITILRYLESMKDDERIGGVVLVAGFTNNLGYQELNSYFARPIDWDAIRVRCAGGFFAIHSDNDKYVSLEHADIFKEKLGASIVVLHDMKHFEVGSGIKELPEARDAVLRLAGMQG